jgi:hypothetical protein
MTNYNFLLAILAAMPFAQCHPGQSKVQLLAELSLRNAYISQMPNKNLAHCQPKLLKRDQESMVERRSNVLKAVRRQKGLDENGPHYLAKRQIPGLGDLKLGDLYKLMNDKTPVTVASMNHKTNLTVPNPR